MELQEILARAVESEASDILLVPGLPVAYKIDGVIQREGERLLPDQLDPLVGEITAMPTGTAPGWSRWGTTTSPSPFRGCPVFGSMHSVRGAHWGWSSAWWRSPCPTGSPWESRTR